MQSKVNKLFDPKNPMGKFLKYGFSLMAAALAIHFLINHTIDVSKHRRESPFLKLLSAPQMDDSTINELKGVGRDAMLKHLYQTKQIDTVFINLQRLRQIEDSILLTIQGEVQFLPDTIQN
jgi:hypothetical protein